MRIACLSPFVVALAMGGVIAIAAKDAEACSCPLLEPQYQLPQAGGTLPANGVIVLAMSPAHPPALFDSNGFEVPLEVVPMHSIWGGCLSSIAFARSVEPLAVGESFSAGGATFTVGAAFEPVTTDLAITFELSEHAPVDHSFHYCSSPGETTHSVGVKLSFTFPQKVVLVAEAASAQVDQRSPVIIEAPAAASSEPHAVRHFAENAQQGCASAWVYDVTGALLKQAEQCFAFVPPSDGGTTSLDGGSPSPDSASSSSRDSDSEGGCQVNPRGRGSPLVALLVLMGLALRRARRAVRSALD